MPIFGSVALPAGEMEIAGKAVGEAKAGESRPSVPVAKTPAAVICMMFLREITSCDVAAGCRKEGSLKDEVKGSRRARTT